MTETTGSNRWEKWLGRSEERRDRAECAPLARLAALLDYEKPPWAGTALPPLAHWLYFLPTARQSSLDRDGHQKRGNFLPPIDLPREMWAGSHISFHAPITLGAEMLMRSTISSIVEKTGRQGRLVFIAITHDVSVKGELCVREVQNLVYREEEKKPDGAPPAVAPAVLPHLQHKRSLVPDAPLLFRFSAVTFNSHRIHYDLNHAREIEGYPDLVVHGPLTAMLMVDLLFRVPPKKTIREIEFRGRAPAFCNDPMTLGANITGAMAEVSAFGPLNNALMTATALLSD